MLVAALIVGGLTAYYFGIRPGAYAAVATAVLLFAAMIIPGITWIAYGAVGVGIVGVVLIGPKYGKSMGITGTRAAVSGLKKAKDYVVGFWSKKK